ncbi:MAG TPA: MgtC/SapB family protein [Candidatus Hydrogenedentes bacterium]|nr:MgtC/SapB family protein [Candidatus Hydrogenedentota bacterium]
MWQLSGAIVEFIRSGGGTLTAAMAEHAGLDAFVKFAVALVLSGAVGYERQRRGEAAGLRTHILVCLGSTLLMLVSNYLALEWMTNHAQVWLDRGRIAAGIITGVGFLGAGAILHYGREQHGLTTAAMLWFVATLGVAIGLGYFTISVLATLFALLVVIELGRLEKFMPSRGYFLLEMRVDRNEADIDVIQTAIEKMGVLRVRAARIQCSCQEDTVHLTFRIESKRAHDFAWLARQLHTTFSAAKALTFERHN